MGGIAGWLAALPAIVKLALEVISIVREVIAKFEKTPEEKRRESIGKVHDAIKEVRKDPGFTDSIERIVNRGKV